MTNMRNLMIALLIVKSSIDLIKLKEDKKETQKHISKEKGAIIESYAFMFKPSILVFTFQYILSFYLSLILS